jgi:tetratricopeptide (TPR) repeat protein
MYQPIHSILSFAMRAALLVAAFCGLTASAATFDQANQLYEQGKFQEAKDAYEQLLASGQSSAALYYNLGNTEFRLDSHGRAILNYERSLALAPGHPEAQANLKFVREQAGSHLPSATWLDRLALPWTANAYTLLAAVSAWIIVFSIAAMWLWRQSESLALWMVLFLAITAAGYSGFGLWHHWQQRSLAIVTAKESIARLAPADRAGTVETLPAGSRVDVLSERGDWIYCQLPGREVGWLPAGTIEKVRPAKS